MLSCSLPRGVGHSGPDDAVTWRLFVSIVEEAFLSGVHSGRWLTASMAVSAFDVPRLRAGLLGVPPCHPEVDAAELPGPGALRHRHRPHRPGVRPRRALDLLEPEIPEGGPGRQPQHLVLVGVGHVHARRVLPLLAHGRARFPRVALHSAGVVGVPRTFARLADQLDIFLGLGRGSDRQPKHCCSSTAPQLVHRHRRWVGSFFDGRQYVRALISIPERRGLVA
mmetsp:Transcript_75448/g.191492  ORF Transcript_75448/g.191492 Transcript_75448/m.191492 type:complete len:223 (-) Transcript_75448:288-956(-)